MERASIPRFPNLDAAATLAGCTTDEERDEFIADLRDKVAVLRAETHHSLAELQRQTELRRETARRGRHPLTRLFGR
jgi:hypothetical protein